MFDNNENQFGQEDANLEESSQPQESPESQQESAKESTESQEKQVPFHEHPRFKELIEYRRQSEERLSNYERQMSEMQRQYQEALKANQPVKEANPFVARLKEIDPKYGEWAETIESRAAKAEALEQRIQEFERQQFSNQAVTTVNSLHEQNKVSPEMREFYNAQLIAAESQGRIRRVDDIQAVYKQIHEQVTKVFEARDRATRASYVTDKSKDASSPTSQPKGKSAGGRNDKSQYTGDREHDMALIAKRALKISKAENDI